MGRRTQAGEADYVYVHRIIGEGQGVLSYPNNMKIYGYLYIKDRTLDYMTVYKSRQSLRLHCGEIENKDIREIELEIKDDTL